MIRNISENHTTFSENKTANYFPVKSNFLNLPVHYGNSSFVDNYHNSTPESFSGIVNKLLAFKFAF